MSPAIAPKLLKITVCWLTPELAARVEGTTKGNFIEETVEKNNKF